jgi:hypothetical protein
MTLQDSNSIDVVAHDPHSDEVLLVMAEVRPWGEKGDLLLELQAKLKAYLIYCVDGQLTRDYPAFAKKPIRIELRTEHPLGSLEKEFLAVATDRWLTPEHISFAWKLLPVSEPRPERKPWWRVGRK